MQNIDQKFKKSSFSQYGDGNKAHCVEVKRTEKNIYVRDSKNANKGTLEFTNDEWLAFIDGVKNNEFEL